MSNYAELEPRVIRAIQQIAGDYGDRVSVQRKNKILTKFGRHDSLGTSFETIWQVGGNEAYPTGNNIDILTSTDGGDDQDVIIEGHTISGSALTFVVQPATLDGTNNVSLTTPLYRATRVYNDDNTDFAGTVTVEDNGTSVHLSTDGASNQSLKCATAISDQDYWIITEVGVGVNRQQTRSVDFRLQIREFGKVFRTRLPVSCSSQSGQIVVPLNPCIIVPRNADVRIIGASSSTGTGASAFMNGILAITE